MALRLRVPLPTDCLCGCEGFDLYIAAKVDNIIPIGDISVMSSASLHVNTPSMGVVCAFCLITLRWPRHPTHSRPRDHVWGLISAPSVQGCGLAVVLGFGFCPLPMRYLL